MTQSCLHAKFWFIGSNQKKKTRKKKDEKIEKRKNKILTGLGRREDEVEKWGQHEQLTL